MKPKFTAGKNIALKTPAHEYEKVIQFYKDILGFNRLDIENLDPFDSECFEFGDKRLWVDRIEGLSQSETWLEIESDDIESAKQYLVEKGCQLRDEIEPLPSEINGFWLSSPSNIIHLVIASED